MNVLLNFSSLKAGGGQNVAVNFLSSFLRSKDSDENNYFYVVCRGSVIDGILRENGESGKMVCVSANPIIRGFQELFFSKYLKRFKIDVVYTYFGYALYPKKVPQVIGCAFSNVFYPEIEFWSHYHGLNLLRKKLVDKFRLWGIRRADGIIFETDILNKRSKDILNVKGLTTTIKPSISFSSDDCEFVIPNGDERKKGLFLCGWQTNKNIMAIPEIASFLKEKHFPFTFIITAPNDNSDCQKTFLQLVESYHVEEYINIVGPVPKKQLKSLYQQVDVVFLLSKLESFSNNIIESWSFERPMIVADELWARDICGDSALYVDRDNNEVIADGIIELMTHPNISLELVRKGKEVLSTYPDIDSKTRQELAFIKKVYETVR